ncbi:MAG: hypothetical protein QM608_00390 [Caulobacter sp.]
MKYEAAGKARFEIDRDDGQTIRIRASRQIFPLLFLPVWLVGWTAGGIAAIHQLLTEFEPFIAFWLCAWVLGWAFAAVTFAWMIGGVETLRVVQGDLEAAMICGPWSRRKLYQGALVRALRPSSQDPMLTRFQFGGPFAMKAMGAIQFSYGARSVRVAQGLDETEARLVVEHLLKRLPASAAAA